MLRDRPIQFEGAPASNRPMPRPRSMSPSMTPNLIADAGLVPVVALAERVGLPGLVADHVVITEACNGAGVGFPS